MKASVLIVDDDLPIADIVLSILKKDGYRARHVSDANSAYAALKNEKFDLMLLDIEMPGISGLSLLEIIKKDDKTALIPTIMLSIRKEDSFKVRGLKGGADDYLVKPFSAPELLARVEALLRRTQASAKPADSLEVGKIHVDLERRLVAVGKHEVELTPTEYEILTVLMRREGSVITAHQLLENLSESLRDMTSGNIYCHVGNLRKKLGPEGKRIETVYGTGYRLSGKP